MCFSVNEMGEMWNGWHRRDGVMDGEWGICIVLVWMGKGVMVMDRGRFRNSGRGYYTFYLYQLCILEKIINYPMNIQKVFTIKFSSLRKSILKKKKKKNPKSNHNFIWHFDQTVFISLFKMTPGLYAMVAKGFWYW